LTILLSGLFVVTILALIAGIFGDPQAPAARLLDRWAGWLLGGEVVGILTCGFLALATDRRQTLRNQTAANRSQTQAEQIHDADHSSGN
jgi:hypothetical protein